ncbi:MAG: hypothetical protein K8S18_04245, partial [Desulfobacula sp.]|nr:hypothetical protein [Desulfobacula sp.]
SPVFITGPDRNYFINPADLTLKMGKIRRLIRSEAPFRSNLPGENRQWMSNYGRKDALYRFLISGDAWLPLTIPFNKEKLNVFIPEERIGIQKNKEGGTKEEAFYKQLVYRLRDGFSFGVIAEMDGIEQGSGFVSFGAEKNPFKIEIKSCTDDFDKLVRFQENNAPEIVLTSDAFMPNYEEAFRKCSFIINRVVSFRFLRSTIQQNTKYYSSNPLTKDGVGIKRSTKFNLLEKGSVFLFDNTENMKFFANRLKDQHNFRQIGYNYYKEFK